MAWDKDDDHEDDDVDSDRQRFDECIRTLNLPKDPPLALAPNLPVGELSY